MWKRWLRAARSPMRTLAGGWLRVLAVLNPTGTTLSTAVRHFEDVREALGGAATPVNLRGKNLTRFLYREALDSSGAAPRAEAARADADWPLIWARLASRTLPLEVRAAWYKAVHRVIPTRARLHSIGRAATPKCETCSEVENIAHQLVECGPARKIIWRWVARKLEVLTGTRASDFQPEIMSPDFTIPKEKEATATWLLGSVAHYLI